jgi:G3E family GTPase
MSSDPKTPVTVITGFLGSGKTTLINRLLRSPDLADTAVVVNEFGEIGIDHHLVESAREDIILMRNGCVCCSVRGDLVDTLSDLAARRAAGATPAFARVIVETTGLADPAPVMQTLLGDPAVTGAYQLRGLVTTVDATNWERQRAAHREAAAQVALADRLLLTKSDLAAAPDRARVTASLGAANPFAEVVEATHGAVAPDLVLAAFPGPRADAPAGIFQSVRPEEPHEVRRLEGHSRGLGAARIGEAAAPDSLPATPFETALRASSGRTEIESAHVGDDHAPHHAHDDAIRSFAVRRVEPVAWPPFADWLGSLVSLRGADILRIKGLVNVKGSERPLVVHGVHHVFYPPTALAAWPDADRSTRLVFITRGLDLSNLGEAIAAAVA